MRIPALDCIDIYKADHRRQYPDGTSLVFSNWTARGSRVPGVTETIHFGLSYFLQAYLQDNWNETFFMKPKEEVVSAYARRMAGFGINVPTDHIGALHDLGYLPIEIWSLPEGTRVPIGVPSLVMWNTIPEFFWLVNYLETSLSNTLWLPTTSATTAAEYRRILDSVAKATGGDPTFVDWQAHDFSFRGMAGLEAAALSGAGHLTSFTGSDTVPAVDFLERYYGATGLIAGSVPATEHSVMCMGGKLGELETYRRLLGLYPTGIVSVVSDTWDYWSVLTSILPQLREDILGRDGKLVIRPDSGDPVKIIVGDLDAPAGSPEFKGSIELLWELFGGTVNAKGYKVLDPHVGLIYGDSITLDRASRIADGLMAKGFCPTVVLGVGSYTYQYVTRDTFGFAIKATAGVVNGEAREIYKDPKTDNGTKRSAKGLLAVFRDAAGKLYLKQQATWDEVCDCEFEQVFVNGDAPNLPTLADIRARVRG